MIETFLKNTPDQLNQLREARKSRDWNTAARLVHKMKPSVTFMGISGVKEAIQKILDYEIHLPDLPVLVKNFETVMKLACKELEENEVLNN